MGVDLRPVTDEELAAFWAACHTGFGLAPPDEADLADRRTSTELDRTLAAFDGGRIVATSGAFSFELTVPGPTSVPAAAVTAVTVLPTHRRQGLLTRMMGGLLDQAREREEPVAILLASESVIYGRFGFGPATAHAAVEIDRRHGALLGPGPGGRVRLLDGDEAAKVLPGVLDRARRRQPGDVGRPGAWWDHLFRDPEKGRDGASPAFYAVHESPAGEADGYAMYRVTGGWEHGSPRKRVRVDEIVSLGAGAESGLWAYLLNIDLTEVVEARSRPVDDPLRWMLADPRRLRVTMVSDFLWVRLLDVAAALGARRYPIPGRLVLDVVDPAHADVAGRYALDGGPDGAECAATGAEPDLSLSVADLGALYLGGAAPSALARAGRVVERRPGALARADALFASQPPPFCRTGF